jgi:hypothetical protein
LIHYYYIYDAVMASLVTSDFPILSGPSKKNHGEFGPLFPRKIGTTFDERVTPLRNFRYYKMSADPLDTSFFKNQLSFLNLLQEYIDQQIGKIRFIEKNHPEFFDAHDLENVLNDYYNVLLRLQDLCRSIRGALRHL